MKDSIVEEIHRFREEHVRKFNYDVHAFCEDLRTRQTDSTHKLMGWDTKRKRMVEVKRPRAAREKTLTVQK